MGNPEPSRAEDRIDLARTPEFELGGMRISPADRAVMLDGERRELQPRLMQVLVALAKAKPSVVSRDRLIELCWDGRVVGDDALNRCVLGLRHVAHSFTPEPFTIQTVPRVGYRLVEKGTAAKQKAPTKVGSRTTRTVLTAISIIASLIALAFVAPRLWRPQMPAPTVLVSAAADDKASLALAQELAAKLASFDAARTASFRVVEQSAPSERDLVLQVGRISDIAVVGANLILRSGSDSVILWSEELRQPSNRLADLKEQVAIVATNVLRCASEGLEARLKQDTLKTYLSGCASLAKLEGIEAQSVVPLFREVLQVAPHFEGAWAKLLAADSSVLEHTQTIQAKERLKTDLAAAKRVNSDMPEALLAEISLLPSHAYERRILLANRAVELNPNSAGAYATRAVNFQAIGRTRDAVVDARRAMQLDPISPAARNTYILALGAAGLHDSARLELREAERLWPGASSVAAARFAFNLRYGDPQLAWDYLRVEPAADWMNARSYLEARGERAPAQIDRAIEDAQELYRRDPSALQHLIQVYGEFDREDDLITLLLQAPERDLAVLDMTFRSSVLNFWDNPRSLVVAKKVGLLTFWSQSGLWPDFCFKPALPYDCRAEAAKLTTAPGVQTRTLR